MNDNAERTVILGVSSSISLYKACEVVRGLQKQGLLVQVIMTENAAKLISPRLFQALTGRPVYTDLFAPVAVERIAHIDLARQASLLVVAPATANVIAKLAAGIADDVLTTLALAVTCPVVVAPAMNTRMYRHVQTQENMDRLRARGIRFVEPGRGRLACGDEGWGRLAPPEEIVRACRESLALSTALKGKTVVVTAGPTREPLDPVRYLSNRSSGKMGYALAEEAACRGANVVLVAGPTALPAPSPPIGLIGVETAAEMKAAVHKAWKAADILIMAAAVSDFAPARASARKIKKQGETWELSLSPTADILFGLGSRKGGRILIGFAAETEDVEENARKKLEGKNLDMIVANDVSRPGVGFDADHNQVLVLFRDGRSFQTERMSKRDISRVLFNEIEGIIARKQAPHPA